MVVNVQAAIYKDKKWLLIKRGSSEGHAPGEIALPGGTVNADTVDRDVLEQTVNREIWEELGITLEENPQYVCSASFVADDKDYVVNIVFLCTYPGNQPVAMNEEEVEDVYRLSTDDVLYHEEIPSWTKEYIEKADELLKKLADEKLSR